MSDRLLNFTEILTLKNEWDKCDPAKRSTWENTLLKAQRDLTAATVNAEWVGNVEKACDEYGIWPITMDSERMAGGNQVIFNRKPEFPEFLKCWQERKRSMGL